MKKFYDDQTIPNWKIAKETGIDIKTIYRIDDKKRLDIRKLLKIAEVVGLEPTDLAHRIIARWDREISGEEN